MPWSGFTSEDSLWRLCQKEAQRHDQEQGESIKAIDAVQQRCEQELPTPSFVAATDIYADIYADYAEQKEEGKKQDQEIVILADAICVPAQKPTRQKVGQPRQSKKAKRHDTDVFVLPRPDGGEEFFCEAMSETWSCVSAVSAFLRREWSGKQSSVDRVFVERHSTARKSQKRLAGLPAKTCIGDY